ncbi:hypothetical protein OF83DRAFT_1108546 [Amylostereum chailletii]|nr:hypothetical protein OF83DRAFT_1108546 [Amylostereum chailletii]
MDLPFVRKKKSKSKDKDAAVKEILKRDSPTPGSPSGSGRNSPAIAGSSADRKTEAERRFQEVQRKRVRWSARRFVT